MANPIDALISLYIDALSSVGQSNLANPPVRVAQIKQYLNPDKKILPDAKYKPTALTKWQDRRFVSQAEFLPDFVPMPDYLIGKPVPNTPTKIDLGFDSDPRLSNSSDLIRALNPMRLGRFTASLGKDKEDPYLSIFDAWDFDEPKSTGLVIGDREFASRGKPFNVYDRMYYAPGHNNTIPAFVHKNSRRADIPLPVEALQKVK